MQKVLSFVKRDRGLCTLRHDHEDRGRVIEVGRVHGAGGGRG